MKDILVIATGGKYDVSRLESATGSRGYRLSSDRRCDQRNAGSAGLCCRSSHGMAALDSGIYEERLKQGEALQRSVMEQLSKLDSPASSYSSTILGVAWPSQSASWRG